MSVALEQARLMAARSLSHRPGAQGGSAGLKNTLSSYLISKPAGSAGTTERLLLLLSPSRVLLGDSSSVVLPSLGHCIAVLLLLLSPSPRLALGQLLCCSAQPGTLHCCIASAAFTQPASCLGTAPVLFCPAWDTTLFAVSCMAQPHRPAWITYYIFICITL